MRALLAAAVLVALATPGSLAQTPRVPVLVELYTSEGCSSCPPADALLASLLRDQPLQRAEVVPIGLHVDYFNDLGWKDTFSSASFTARQGRYLRRFSDNLYTPQIVIDGQNAIPGGEVDLVRRAIESAAQKPHLPVDVTARFVADQLRLTIHVPSAPPHAERIQIVAAITENGLSSVVTRGENRGRTLHHVAVARTVQELDSLSGNAAVREKQLPLGKDWNHAALNAVVWLQGTKSRHVYGTAAAIPAVSQ